MTQSSALCFHRKEMLASEHFDRIKRLLRSAADKAELSKVVRSIQQQLNPHPIGQTTLNVPRIGNEKLPGPQHKYRDTLLFFSDGRANVPFLLQLLLSLATVRGEQGTSNRVERQCHAQRIPAR